MLNTTTNQMEIAVRLYENGTYGSTYGKGKFRKALFNGTVDVKEMGLKYLVDFYNYEDWSNLAKTDGQMAVLANVEGKTDTLYSWVKLYDATTQEKSIVDGLCQIDMDSLDITVLICDEERSVEQRWDLQAKPCKARAGVKSPQLLATNAQLGSW